MLILLDSFAEMLDVKPEELQRAIRAEGELGGLPLPAHQHLLGAVMMFDAEDAAVFARQWHKSVGTPQPDVTSDPPVSLVEFSTQAGIAPLALYQAVTSGRKLRGVRPPEPLSTVPSLVFDSAAVSHFVDTFRGLLKKNDI